MTDATAKRLAWGLFTLCCLFYLADILVPLVARAQVGRSGRFSGACSRRNDAAATRSEAASPG